VMLGMSGVILILSVMLMLLTEISVGIGHTIGNWLRKRKYNKEKRNESE